MILMAIVQYKRVNYDITWGGRLSLGVMGYKFGRGATGSTTCGWSVTGWGWGVTGGTGWGWGVYR